MHNYNMVRSNQFVPCSVDYLEMLGLIHSGNYIAPFKKPAQRNSQSSLSIKELT